MPFSVYLYTLRGFYALHDTFTPFWINAIENGVNIVLAIALFPSLGVQGLALAWSGAYTVAAVIALVVLAPPRARTRSTGRSAASALRAVVGTVALAIVAASLAAAIGHPTANRALLATAVAGLGRARRRTSSRSSSLRTPELGSLVGVLRRRAPIPPTCEPWSATCNHGPFATDRNYPDPRRSHGRSRRDRQCL